jgi:hypothetical protein
MSELNLTTPPCHPSNPTQYLVQTETWIPLSWDSFKSEQALEVHSVYSPIPRLAFRAFGSNRGIDPFEKM